jgi:uncharacterized membrane protein
VGTGRLEAFSDGVFAVAITLLALNLAVGGPELHGPTLAFKLKEHWPAFAAYAISFATIGIIWVNHHALLRNFSEIDRTLLFVNLLLLFFVVSIPFATDTIAAYLRERNGDAALAAALYQGVFEGMSIAFTLLFWQAIRRGHLLVAFTPQQGRQAAVRFGIGNLGYIAGIGVAFVSAPASLAISGLVAVYYIFEHTPAPGQPGSDHGGTGAAADSTSRNTDSAALCVGSQCLAVPFPGVGHVGGRLAGLPSVDHADEGPVAAHPAVGERFDPFGGDRAGLGRLRPEGFEALDDGECLG